MKNEEKITIHEFLRLRLKTEADKNLFLKVMSKPPEPNEALKKLFKSF